MVGTTGNPIVLHRLTSSGRQGVIGWLNGTDGALNGQRTINFTTQLATFFSQPRYKNVITMVWGCETIANSVVLDIE